jgi:hypothetical protein
MSDVSRKLSSFVGIALLYVLASPIFLMQAIGAAFAASRRRSVVVRGFLTCRFCGFRGNRLDRLVHCRCGFNEFRSLALPCSECHETVGWIDCAGCGASLRLS